MLIDPTSEFGARVQRRLTEETVGWLTTVDADGTPQPSPIWFLWNGETVLIFSKPDAPKVRNIRERPHVSLHLNNGADGGDMVILTGEAVIDANPPSEAETAAYVQRYTEGVKALGWTWEQLTSQFSTAIRFTPVKLRGF